MPTCEFCNTSIAPGSKSCPKCGAALFRDGLTDTAAGTSSGMDDDLLSLIRRGQKIEAIKRYRAQTGAGLAEAKTAVETIAREHGLASMRSGCAGILLLCVVAVSGAAAWLFR